MISYTNKDIEAVAMLRPAKAAQAKIYQKDIEKLIAKARQERSVYIGGFFKKIFGAQNSDAVASSVIDFPQTTVNTSGVMDVDSLLVQARREQARAFAAAITSALKQVATKYRSHRDARKAADKLFSMSSRELDDLGLTHGDVEAVVYGRTKDRSALTARIAVKIDDLVSRFRQWRKDREGYAELMALDDKGLADLGISRGEISSVFKYGRDAANVKANDNINVKAANDDQRRAV